MVSFSGLTDEIEPELLSDILNTYLTRMSEVAISYGGTVDKFIGDAVVVFFGAPVFTDDVYHARQCALMALEMREELFRLQDKWRQKIDRSLQVRAGIATGFCTVGNFGSENRMDYTIIGRAINLSNRLETLCPPDHIYISGATRALIEDEFETIFAGQHDLKGFHKPVDVWELVGTRKEGDTISPYLKVEDTHLSLKALDLDLATLSDLDRAALQKVFTRALVDLALPRN
jgi:class 3 adenylate cyclase